MSAFRQYLYRNPHLGYVVFVTCTLLLILILTYAFRPLDLTPADQLQCGPGIAYLNGLCIAP